MSHSFDLDRSPARQPPEQRTRTIDGAMRWSALLRFVRVGVSVTGNDRVRTRCDTGGDIARRVADVSAARIVLLKRVDERSCICYGSSPNSLRFIPHPNSNSNSNRPQ